MGVPSSTWGSRTQGLLAGGGLLFSNIWICFPCSVLAKRGLEGLFGLEMILVLVPCVMPRVGLGTQGKADVEQRILEGTVWVQEPARPARGINTQSFKHMQNQSPLIFFKWRINMPAACDGQFLWL